MPILFLLVIFGIIGAVVFWNFKQAEARRMVWRQAGRKLGLRHFPGGNPFRAGVLKGKHDNLMVVVDVVTEGGNNNKQLYTRFSVDFSRHLKLGLNLTRQGMMQNFGKLFGVQDIELGDHAFDNLVVVKGMNPEAVKGFLERKRRKHVVNIFSTYKKCKIDDRHVEASVRGELNNSLSIIRNVERLVDFAHGFVGDQKKSKSHHTPEESIPLPQYGLGGQEGIEDAAIAGGVEEIVYSDEAVPGSPAAMEELQEEELVEEALQPEELSMEEMIEEVVQEPELLELEETVPEPIEETVEPEPIEVVVEPPQTNKFGMEDFIRPAPEAELKQAVIPATFVSESGLSVAVFADKLFAGDPMSSEVAERFNEFKSQEVSWSGVLKRTNKYSTDFVFRGKPGCKATFEIYEFSGILGSRGKMKAIVQLPEEAYEQLRNATDQTFTFKASLFKVEGLVREVFLADGEII